MGNKRQFESEQQPYGKRVKQDFDIGGYGYSSGGGLGSSFGGSSAPSLFPSPVGSGPARNKDGTINLLVGLSKMLRYVQMKSLDLF